MYRRADRVVEKITKLKKNVDYDQTYCSLTLDIAQTAKKMVVSISILMVMKAIEFLLGENFVDVLVSKDFSNTCS